MPEPKRPTAIEECVDAIAAQFEQTTIGHLGDRYTDRNQLRGSALTLGEFRRVAETEIASLILRMTTGLRAIPENQIEAVEQLIRERVGLPEVERNP